MTRLPDTLLSFFQRLIGITTRLYIPDVKDERKKAHEETGPVM